MNLINILKRLKGAEQSHAALSQNEPGITKEAFSNLGSEITALRAAVEAEFRERVAITTELKAACSSFKLNLPEEASEIEMITALQNSVASTLSKLHVPLSAIPMSKPSGTITTPNRKTITRAEWRSMNPAHALDFFRAGGTIID